MPLGPGHFVVYTGCQCSNHFMSRSTICRVDSCGHIATCRDVDDGREFVTSTYLKKKIADRAFLDRSFHSSTLSVHFTGRDTLPPRGIVPSILDTFHPTPNTSRLSQVHLRSIICRSRRPSRHDRKIRATRSTTIPPSHCSSQTQ